MIDFRIINYLEYNGKEYIVLCDKENKYFFLENDRKNNCKRYISIEELLELSNIICFRDNGLMQFAFEANKTKKIRIIPKVIVAGVVLPLTFTVLQACGINPDDKAYAYDISYTNESELDSVTQQRLNEYYATVEKDSNNFVERSIDSHGTLVYVNDSLGLNEVFGNTKEDVTYDDIRGLIKELNVPDGYKDIYLTLADNLEKQYPHMDLRIWKQNLLTLSIEEKSDTVLKGMGIDYAAYDMYSNIIYMQDDYDYVPGTLEYQIIVHEFTHPIRSASFKMNDKNYVCRFSKNFFNYKVVDEAMTSILSLRSYDPDETHIGYAFQSHMLEIMIECMDNYKMDDYINEDISYFINKLNETNGDKEAIRMLNLMQLNRDDVTNSAIYFEQDQFYDLYDYVARMYYRKHINSNMSSEEIKAVKDELVTRIITDVPEETAKEFDAAHFDDYLVEYCNENGINYSPSTKVK